MATCKVAISALSVILLCSIPVGVAQQCDVQVIIDTVVNTLLPVLKEIKADFNNLTELYNDLNEKVCSLEETVKEHKSHTSSGLTDLQMSIDNPPINAIGNSVLVKLLPYLNNIEENLSERIDESANSLFSDFLDYLLSINQEVTDLSVKVCDVSDTVGELKNHTTSELADIQEQLLNVTGDIRDVKKELTKISENLDDCQQQDCIENHTLPPTTPQPSTTTITTPPTVDDSTNLPPVLYECGGAAGWRRVVKLNMTDPYDSCPSDWCLGEQYPKRTCIKCGFCMCSSVYFPVTGGVYSKVCGSIRGYQYDDVRAFEAYVDEEVTDIDGPFVDGVIITHGDPRRHIWTFAAGRSEDWPFDDTCPCDTTITIDTPSFVGEDYFCESGVSSGFPGPILYSDDPLWDGDGCISSSTCCEFNNPPYFTKQLTRPTTDDIEVRLCIYDYRADIAIELIELYVK